MIKTFYKKVNDHVHVIATPWKEEIESFSISCYFSLGGAFFEPREKAGVSHLMEHCLVSSMDDRSTTEIQKDLYLQAISRNAETSGTHMQVMIRGYKNDFKNILNTFDKFTFHHKFREDILEQEKKIVISEIKQQYMNPQNRLRDYVVGELYNKESYYQYKTLGTIESVQAITLDDIVARYNKMMQESHLLFQISGIAEKFHVDNEVLELTKNVSRINRAKAVNYVPDKGFNSFKYRPLVHEVAPDNVSLKVFIPVTCNYENAVARAILRRMLLIGPFGLLHQKLRVEKGVIYSLSASFDPDCTLVEIQMSTSKDAVHNVIEELGKILDMKNLDSVKNEFPEVKESFLKHQYLAYENEYLASANIMESELLKYGTPHDLNDYFEACKKVSVEDIEKVFIEWSNNFKNHQIAILSRDETIKNLKF